MRSKGEAFSLEVPEGKEFLACSRLVTDESGSGCREAAIKIGRRVFLL